MAIVLLATGRLVAAGYLAVVGPAPIRLQAAPKPPSPLLKLFPLAAPSVPSIPSDTNRVVVPVSTNAALASANSETITVTSPAPEGTDPTVTNRLPELAPATPPNETLTPQMLVPFFHRKSDGPAGKETGVFGSMSFTPPRPETRPSSKATLKSE